MKSSIFKRIFVIMAITVFLVLSLFGCVSNENNTNNGTPTDSTKVDDKIPGENDLPYFTRVTSYAEISKSLNSDFNPLLPTTSGFDFHDINSFDKKTGVQVLTYQNLYSVEGSDTQISFAYTQATDTPFYNDLFTDEGKNKIIGNRTFSFSNPYSHIDFCASQFDRLTPKTYGSMLAAIWEIFDYESFQAAVENGYSDVEISFDFTVHRNLISSDEDYFTKPFTDQIILANTETENENDSHTRYAMGVWVENDYENDRYQTNCSILATRKIGDAVYLVCLPVYGFALEKDDPLFESEAFLNYHDEIFSYAKSACDNFFNGLKRLRQN